MVIYTAWYMGKKLTLNGALFHIERTRNKGINRIEIDSEITLLKVTREHVNIWLSDCAAASEMH